LNVIDVTFSYNVLQPLTSEDLELAVSTFVTLLNDQDSYVYLSILNSLTKLADLSRHLVFNTLLESFSGRTIDRSLLPPSSATVDPSSLTGKFHKNASLLYSIYKILYSRSILYHNNVHSCLQSIIKITYWCWINIDPSSIVNSCLRLSCSINNLNFCVHYLCLIGWVYVFYVGHIERTDYMESFSIL
jgi:hypothetical protein